MKKILFLISICYSFNLFGGDKVLFIDANRNPTEIKVAREAAKVQGKELIVYPQTGKTIDMEELSALFDKNSFSSLHFSGHSGGLEFYGTNGEVNLDELADLIKDKPSVKNIESLYLLGCNSGNKSKMLFWKETLPQLKFIAGFDGVAPVGTNQAGLSYYADILKNENKILNSANSNEIKRSLENLKNVKSFPTSLLVKCNEQSDFLYQPKTNLGKNFSNFTVKECIELNEKFKREYAQKIDDLISGQKDLKKESAANLKQYYEAARQKEHCSEDPKEALEANTVLFLRFMQGFDNNFSSYYKKELEGMIDYLKTVDLNIQSNIDKQLKIRKEVLNKFINDPEYKKSIIEKNQKNLQARITKLNTNSVVKNCYDAINGGASSDSEAESRCRVNNPKEQMEIDQVMHLSEFAYIVKRATPEFIIRNVFESEIKDLEKNSIDELKKSIDQHVKILEKIKSNPKEITREEIKKVQEHASLRALGLNPDVANNYKKIMEAYASLDPTAFPYSWYDKPHGEAIEHPSFNGRVTVDFKKADEYSTDTLIYRSEINLNEL